MWRTLIPLISSLLRNLCEPCVSRFFDEKFRYLPCFCGQVSLSTVSTRIYGVMLFKGSFLCFFQGLTYASYASQLDCGAYEAEAL
jgi:hypothetical protein